MEYRIAWRAGKGDNDNQIGDLVEWVEAQVNASMENGFRPIGGVSISRADTEDDTWVIVAQALVHKD
jgi:hypothetical protein